VPIAARRLAVSTVAVCVLVLTVQGVWIRHGMETSWVDATVNAKVVAALGEHPLLLAVLVWPGEPVPFIAMTAALALACVLRRRYEGAALVAISVLSRPPSRNWYSSLSSVGLPGATRSRADT